MSATTRWKDARADNLDTVIKKITDPIPNDERTNSIYWTNFTTQKILENNGALRINGDEVKYNAIRYGYDQVTAQDNPDLDRAIRKNGLIVIYKYVGGIYYIVEQNSTAKKLLRKLLGYTGRNEIEDFGFNFNENFFVWLVNEVYNSRGDIENTSSSEKKELELEEIKGIRGNTEDFQTKVATSGESVMNVISTLAFLLESSRLNQVILNLQYSGHENICLKLQKSTVEILNPYVGAFSDELRDNMYSKLYLLVYLEILPLIEQEYRINVADEQWDHEAYKKFLTDLKNTIVEKIEEKIGTLN